MGTISVSTANGQKNKKTQHCGELNRAQSNGPQKRVVFSTFLLPPPQYYLFIEKLTGPLNTL